MCQVVCLLAFSSILTGSSLVLTNDVSFCNWNILRFRAICYMWHLLEETSTQWMLRTVGSSWRLTALVYIPPCPAAEGTCRWSCVEQPVNRCTVRSFVIRLGVCVYVFIYMCILYIYAHTHIYVRTYIHMYVIHTYVRTYIHTYIIIHTYIVRTYVHTHACMHTYIRTYKHTNIQCHWLPKFGANLLLSCALDISRLCPHP